MSDWRGYFGIENIDLNASQKATLVQELRQLGQSDHPQPAYLCHWRTRLDNNAVIYEALFDENNLSIDKFKQRIGNIYNINPSSINHSTINRDFASYGTPIVTFSRGGTNYLRMALFGGKTAIWEESRQECLGYLFLHKDLWEEEEEL